MTQGMVVRQTKRTLTAQGIAMVRLSLSVPEEETPGPWAEVCARGQALAEEVSKLARQTLLPQAEAAYLADQNPRKRFRFRGIQVTLTCKIEQKKEGVVTLLWQFSLSFDGKTVANRTHSETYCLPLPQRRCNRRKTVAQ